MTKKPYKFPRPADVKWDVDGFALHHSKPFKFLLEKTVNGMMVAHALKVQTKILRAMTKRQLRRIASLVRDEISRRDRP